MYMKTKSLIILVFVALTLVGCTNAKETSSSSSSSSSSSVVPPPPLEEEIEYEIGETVTKTKIEYGTKYISIATPITNTGEIPIDLLRCEYDLYNQYDEKFDFMFASCIPNVLKPGETGYFYIGQTFYLGKDINDYRVVHQIEIEKADEGSYNRYTVEDATIDQSYPNQTWIKSTLVNDTDKRIKPENLRLAFLIFDKENNFVEAELQSFSEGLNPGESKPFSILYSENFKILPLEDVGNFAPMAYDLI